MFAVCVLTLNAESFIERWVAAIAAQSRRPDRVLVLDSMSTDRTVEVAQAAGFDVVPVQRNEFGHGRTRQAGLERLADCDVVVFMTQDALLAAPDALDRLVAVFDDPSIDVAYGRQLPHLDASLLARHAREHNYPAQGEIRTLVPGSRPGLHVAFCSDSFAAYRVSALLRDGGFPREAMYGEDMLVAARCLLRGGRVAYVADARVHHSHNYSVWQDFRRYFDTGVFHKQHRWLLEEFGRAEGRGASFVKSELRFVATRSPWRVLEVAVRTFARYAGYSMGLNEARWPLSWKRRWSMSRQF